MIDTTFEQVARIVTARSAELFAAETAVLDAGGMIVASSEPGIVGHRFDAIDGEPWRDHLQVPMRASGVDGVMMIQAPANGDIIAPRLAQALVELVANQIATADRMASPTVGKDQFIHDLLHGVFEDEAAILGKAQLLGLDLAPPRAVMLVNATDFILSTETTGERETSDVRIRHRAQFVISSIVDFFHLPNDTICGYIGAGEVAVLKASNTKNLVTWVDER